MAFVLVWNSTSSSKVTWLLAEFSYLWFLVDVGLRSPFSFLLLAGGHSHLLNVPIVPYYMVVQQDHSFSKAIKRSSLAQRKSHFVYNVIKSDSPISFAIFYFIEWFFLPLRGRHYTRVWLIGAHLILLSTTVVIRLHFPRLGIVKTRCRAWGLYLSSFQRGCVNCYKIWRGAEWSFSNLEIYNHDECVLVEARNLEDLPKDIK